ncbi:MAG: HD domain-containing protein, partial [Methyloprofundus sp.]|nr:HD domain-containing protein [Methyloprofundus sp.]
MKSKKSTTYSLHFTTSSLFIILIIVFGSVLSWQNYRKTSEILIASGDQLFDQINSELMLDFGGIRKSVTQTVNFLALSPISQANTLAERLESLVLLSTALANEENMSAIQVGYLNGDYFIVRHIRSEYERKTFSAPESAVFIVDNIATDKPSERSLLRIFYNQKLQEISRNLAQPTSYDPRVRPWYRLALDNTRVLSTEPYLFYFLRKVGLTLSIKSSPGGSVVAADITLDQLSNTLSRHISTANTEIVVFDKNDRALIYKDIKRLVVKTSDNHFKIATLSQLGSDVLGFLSQDLELVSQSLHFNFQGQTWLGAIREMQIPGGNKFFVLMVSPENELLSTANKIRQQSLILTAIIILLTIPIIWFFARKISNPIRHLAIEADLISRFDFTRPVKTRSVITEVDKLAKAMSMMKSTISQFLSLIHSLAGEQNFDALLQRITRQTKQISRAGAALTYLYNEKENTLEPSFMHIGRQDIKELKDIPVISLEAKNELVDALNKKESSLIELSSKHPNSLNVLLEKLATDSLQIIALPLRNRHEEAIGLLCLLYKAKTGKQHNNKHIAFVQELSGFAAVSLEGRQLLMMQKALLESFIKLIADAIDSKSPYTGGHCARVPEITRLIAQAACDSNAPPFQNFQLNEEQWESLHIASWLHDCGKVTTPEYVVDKSTKLETIYDRIHEIRMRVEVLKRDAEIHYWQQVAKGRNIDSLRQELDSKLAQLDNDFAFIAECNEGGEFMAQEKIQRLGKIAEYTWMRTLDDRIGVSWEESQRQQKVPKQALPVAEKLLADKAEHIIEREESDKMPDNNPWGFHLDVPEYKYNRGELYNLSIERGTLSSEERFKINDHIVQTIIMLENLPYPKHLEDVPTIAGSHHEKMDGSGYPKGLSGKEMPLTARMMAIADIFEALTASDRPYKKAKTLSAALHIMGIMVKEQHIDADIFKLFLTSGVYLDYAHKFLD